MGLVSSCDSCDPRLHPQVVVQWTSGVYLFSCKWNDWFLEQNNNKMTQTCRKLNVCLRSCFSFLKSLTCRKMFHIYSLLFVFQQPALFKSATATSWHIFSINLNPSFKQQCLPGCPFSSAYFTFSLWDNYWKFFFLLYNNVVIEKH